MYNQNCFRTLGCLLNLVIHTLAAKSIFTCGFSGLVCKLISPQKQTNKNLAFLGKPFMEPNELSPPFLLLIKKKYHKTVVFQSSESHKSEISPSVPILRCWQG